MKEIKFKYVVLGTIALLAIGLFLSWNLILGSIYFEGGTGTEEDPYQISTLQQLQDINLDKNGYFVLVNDIDASGTSLWNDGKGFDPIANGNNPLSINAFTNTFDGDNHTISNLYINRPDEVGVGMFSCVYNGEIKNLKLIDCNITGGRITGGLTSATYSATISNCVVTGSVTGHQDGVGLISGQMSFFDGSEHSKLINSYVSGTVHATDLASRAGGFGGSMCDITNSYSKAIVTTDSGASTGGLSAYNPYGVITNSYWDIEVSGQTETTGGGTRLTTAEMKDQSNYNGWDFDNVWSINAGVNDGYPTLSSEHNFVDPNSEPEPESTSSSGGGSSTPTIIETEDEEVVEETNTTENTTITFIEESNTNVEDEPYEFNMYQIITFLLIFCLIGVVIYKRK